MNSRKQKGLWVRVMAYISPSDQHRGNVVEWYHRGRLFHTQDCDRMASTSLPRLRQWIDAVRRPAARRRARR